MVTNLIYYSMLRFHVGEEFLEMNYEKKISQEVHKMLMLQYTVHTVNIQISRGSFRRSLKTESNANEQTWKAETEYLYWK